MLLVWALTLVTAATAGRYVHRQQAQTVRAKVGDGESVAASERLDQTRGAAAAALLESSCNFNPESISGEYQANNDVIESMTNFPIAVGLELVNTSSMALSTLTQFHILGGVLSVAATVAGGQLSAALATDPNERRFEAIESWATCTNRQIDILFREIEAIREELRQVDRKHDGIEYMVQIYKLATIKSELTLPPSVGSRTAECLSVTGLAGQRSFALQDSDACDKYRVESALETTKIKSIALKESLDNFALLYRDIDTPYMGETHYFNTSTRPPREAMSNRYPDDRQRIWAWGSHGFRYETTRTILADVIAISELVMTSMLGLRDWAKSRDLHRCPNALEEVWTTGDTVFDQVRLGLDHLLQQLENQFKAEMRSRTTDRFQGRVYCVPPDFFHATPRSPRPAWCEDSQADFWNGSLEYPSWGSTQDRGCWIGHGDCSVENYCNQCMTYHDPRNPGIDCAGWFCELNDYPSYANNYDSSGGAGDAGPMTVLFPEGAPVDPIGREIGRLRQLREAAALSKLFWAEEKTLMGNYIYHGCPGAEPLRLPLGSSSSQRYQGCSACPLPR